LEQRDLPTVDSTIPQSRELYDRFSQAAHNRRNWVQENVIPSLRTMIRGPQPPERRGRHCRDSGPHLVEAVNSVGEALGRFYGPGFREANVAPPMASFYAICEASPSRPTEARSDGSGVQILRRRNNIVACALGLRSRSS
jgi:hypothetical protein